MFIYKKGKKGYIEFSWLFALIVGAIILFLAFYFIGAKLLIKTYEKTTEEAQGIDTLLNPFSYFGELKAKSSSAVNLQQKSTINFSCSQQDNQDLGYDSITLSVKNKEGLARNVYDKYIFAEKEIEAKKLQALSIPLELPWRISEVLILWDYDKKYCFMNAPNAVKETLSDERLNISGIYFANSNCPENSTKVCFATQNSDCEIKVNINPDGNTGTTFRQNKRIYFATDSLMYASIFSDYNIYNCNIKRLASRLKYQIIIYEDKLNALRARGCNTNMDFAALKQKVDSIIESGDVDENMFEMWQLSQEIKNANSRADCKLF